MIRLFLLTLLSLLIVSNLCCNESSDNSESNSDADADTDSDSDTDADTDTDTDADSDSDGDENYIWEVVKCITPAGLESWSGHNIWKGENNFFFVGSAIMNSGTMKNVFCYYSKDSLECDLGSDGKVYSEYLFGLSDTEVYFGSDYINMFDGSEVVFNALGQPPKEKPSDFFKIVDVWGVDGDNLYVLNEKALFSLKNGTDWENLFELENFQRSLEAMKKIKAIDGDNILFMTSIGRVFKYDSTGITELFDTKCTTAYDCSFNDMLVVNSSDIWIAGGDSKHYIVVHYTDGDVQTFEKGEEDSTERARAVFRYKDEIFIFARAVYKYDGNDFVRASDDLSNPSGFYSSTTAVFTEDDNNVYATGVEKSCFHRFAIK